MKEVQDGIRLVSFMDYDLGYFDLQMRALEPLENPFGPKVFGPRFSWIFASNAQNMHFPKGWSADSHGTGQPRPDPLCC